MQDWHPVPLTLSVGGLGILALAILGVNWKREKKNLIPSVHCKDSDLSRYILRNCERLSKPFVPPWWARNTHIQTILSTIHSHAKGVRFGREYLVLKDDGTVALDWAIMEEPGGRDLRDDSPILIALPGLTGDASSVSFLCKTALRSGYRAVVFNKRGHGGSELTTPRLQSFGDPSDLRQVIQHLKAKYSSAKLTAVGGSAGSGLLASYLGEFGSSCYLEAAVCVCPAYDGETTFHRSIKQPYNYFLMRILKKLVQRHAATLSGVIDLEYAMKSNTLLEFEERLYCRMYNYESMAQYWANNNPIRAVHNISIPVMCINSLDDPICVKANIPFEMFEELPNFMLVATKYGGHCGFLEAPDLEPWAEKLSVEYITSVCGFINETGLRK